MREWAPGYVLPNILIQEPIENDYYALASAADPRVVDQRKQHSELDGLLRKFTNEFGVRQIPSVLLLRVGIQPDLITIEAASAFRDLIALSCVCKSRTLSLIYENVKPFQFSSWFDFYPWITSIDYKNLLGTSPAMQGIHVSKNFRGQTIPGLPHREMSTSDCDEVLLSALMGAWERRFVTHRTSRQSVALFRSLNMAYAAAQLPSGPDMTHFALGRAIVLWISAIEILAHPGPQGQVDYKAVYRMLDEVDWESDACKERTHDAYAGKKTVRTNLPCWLYGEMLHARNDFLHGEPVPLDRLVIKSSGQVLYNFAAPLYRACLTSYLGIKPYGPPPPKTALEAFTRFFLWRHDIRFSQHDVERALACALKPFHLET